MQATITRSLDLRGVPEGAQLATAAVAMLELYPGELLEVLSDAPEAPRDFSVWCRAGGHRLVGHDQRDGVHRLLIQRRDGVHRWSSPRRSWRGCPTRSAAT